MFIPRYIEPQLKELLGIFPAVGLLGMRQVGKTTLARRIAANNGLYLDLESEQDRVKLVNPTFFLSRYVNRLVVLDEVHRMPAIFSTLRGLIDEYKRQGQGTGHFLLLGSASLELVKNTSETLAGRLAYLTLPPLQVYELPAFDPKTVWVRGGFPGSLLAKSGSSSRLWRQNFIQTYLEREIGLFNGRVSATLMRRLWMLLAHQQGGLFNAADFARSLGLSPPTVVHYIDLLTDLFVIRRLEPFHQNIGKRLVKTPKLYFRDSGILHSLLGIADFDALYNHPVIGASWEGFVIESVVSLLPINTEVYFYRTAAGAELDLLIIWEDGSRWAFEIKVTESPTLSKSNREAIKTLQPDQTFVIAWVNEPYQISETIEVLGLTACLSRIINKANGIL